MTRVLLILLLAIWPAGAHAAGCASSFEAWECAGLNLLVVSPVALAATLIGLGVMLLLKRFGILKTATWKLALALALMSWPLSLFVKEIMQEDEHYEIADRIHKHFDIPMRTRISEDSMRSELALRLPIGTTDYEVYRYLERHGIGKDTLSVYYPLDDHQRIIAKIFSSPDSSGFMKRNFGITFQMTREKRLESILVQQWFDKAR
jgi:hypothetical protein